MVVEVQMELARVRVRVRVRVRARFKTWGLFIAGRSSGLSTSSTYKTVPLLWSLWTFSSPSLSSANCSMIATCTSLETTYNTLKTRSKRWRACNASANARGCEPLRRRFSQITSLKSDSTSKMLSRPTGPHSPRGCHSHMNKHVPSLCGL